MRERVTWRKKNVAATKDTDGRDEDMSISETEVVFNPYLVWGAIRDKGNRKHRDTNLKWPYILLAWDCPGSSLLQQHNYY